MKRRRVSVNKNGEPSESAIQSAFFDWVRTRKEPQFKTMFAVPNGSYKSFAMAKKFQREGLVSGVPDVVMLAPSYIGEVWYHGLALEFKTRKGVVSPAQRAWLINLCKAGYYARVVRSVEEAIRVASDYLNI